MGQEPEAIAIKTTVYRTLELLSESGMVAITDLGSGRLEYELADRPHHHLICEKCGARIEASTRMQRSVDGCSRPVRIDRLTQRSASRGRVVGAFPYFVNANTIALAAVRFDF